VWAVIMGGVDVLAVDKLAMATIVIRRPIFGFGDSRSDGDSTTSQVSQSYMTQLTACLLSKHDIDCPLPPHTS
jgi:hypothetical protein